MLFWTKKKEKKRERERKKKELSNENPTFTITSPEQRNININFDARYMQWIWHPSIFGYRASIRWYGQDSCDGHNHFNNEWNKPKFVEWGSINLRVVLSYFIVDVLLWK